MFDLVDDTNTSYLKSGFGDSKKSLKKGRKALGESEYQAQGYLDQALDPFKDLSALGEKGEGAYWDLLQNPDSVFDSELYKSREAAGIDSLNRMANSRGMLASGNNTQDIINYMRQGGLDYFNTLTNKYSPYFGLLGSGAAGQAGVYGNKAGTAMQKGTGLANNFSQLAGMNYGFGQDMTNIGMYDSAQDWNALMGLGNLAVGGLQAYRKV